MKRSTWRLGESQAGSTKATRHEDHEDLEGHEEDHHEWRQARFAALTRTGGGFDEVLLHQARRIVKRFTRGSLQRATRLACASRLRRFALLSATHTKREVSARKSLSIHDVAKAEFRSASLRECSLTHQRCAHTLPEFSRRVSRSHVCACRVHGEALAVEVRSYVWTCLPSPRCQHSSQS